MSWLPEPADWPTLKRERGDWDEHVRDLLPAYVNGTLDPSEIGRVATHVERCAGCRAALQSWEAIAGAVRASGATRVRPAARPPDWVAPTVGDPIPPADVTGAASPSWLADPRLSDAAATGHDRGKRRMAYPMTAPSAREEAMTGRPTLPPAARRRPALAEASTAAILVLILVAAVTTVRLAPDGERRIVPGAATDATPPANPAVTVLGPDEAIDIAECAARTRSAGAIADLVNTAAGTTPFLPGFLPRFTAPEDRVVPPVDPDDLLQALPSPRASADELAGIRTTVRQLTACRFFVDTYREFDATAPDDDPLDAYGGRYWALYSDDFFRRELAGLVLGAEPVVSRSLLPSHPYPILVEAAGRLPDGRVVAVLVDQPSAMQIRSLAVFVRQGEHWLIDEVASVAVQPATNAEGGPEPSGKPQFADIAVATTGAQTGMRASFGFEQAFRADQDLTLTIANLGTEPQHLSIPALGIEREIDSGHSADLRIAGVPAGSYDLWLEPEAESSDGERPPQGDYRLVFVD